MFRRLQACPGPCKSLPDLYGLLILIFRIRIVDFIFSLNCSSAEFQVSWTGLSLTASICAPVHEACSVSS